MGSLWKYFEIFDVLRERDERNDPNFDKSSDVQDAQYPNYAVIPNYNHKPEIIPGFHLFFGGCYGFLGAVFIGIPLISMKYRRLGYRDWKLMEVMCLPLIKCSVGGTLFGIGCGALLEVKRIANKDFQKEYNKKVFE